MVSTATVSDRLDEFVDKQEAMSKSVLSEMGSLRASIEENTAIMNKILSALNGKDPILEVDSSTNGHFARNGDHTATPQETIDPKLVDVDCGAKIEVIDFHGDHDPKVFMTGFTVWSHFFSGNRLTEESKLFFAEAKLKGSARVWWTKQPQNRLSAILTWNDMKLAMTRYLVPQNYKQ